MSCLGEQKVPSVLEVRDLCVSFRGAQVDEGDNARSPFARLKSPVHAESISIQPEQLHEISLALGPGERVAVLGPSGSGKTTLLLACMGMLNTDAKITGEIWVNATCCFDEQTQKLPPHQRDKQGVRGSYIALGYQQPMQMFDPTRTILAQMTEVMKAHQSTKNSTTSLRVRACELLELVEMPHVASVLERYPHELSGGMATRAALALALAGEPAVLLADEPTSGLDDETAHALISSMLSALTETQTALLLVSHDWRYARMLCERAIVLDAGRIVEQGTFDAVMEHPSHPITRSLIASALPEVSFGTHEIEWV